MMKEQVKNNWKYMSKRLVKIEVEIFLFFFVNLSKNIEKILMYW